MRKADALPLTAGERSQLEAWAKGRTIQARLMERAQILLLLAEGAEIVRMTTQEKPHNATHWSLSRTAAASGLSTFAVWKI